MQDGHSIGRSSLFNNAINACLQTAHGQSLGIVLYTVVGAGYVVTNPIGAHCDSHKVPHATNIIVNQVNIAITPQCGVH